MTVPEQLFGTQCTVGRKSLARPRLAGFVRSNILLICVLAAGVVCVYVLGLRELPEVASGQQQPAELPVRAALKSLKKSGLSGSAKAGKAMGVVDTFYYQAEQRQIPIGSLPGNPFVNRGRRLEAPAVIETIAEGDQAGSESLRKAMEQAEKLKLQSVLMCSGEATAVISGRLIKKGQEIGGWTVAQIEAHRVVLTWRDHEFVLRMQR